MSITIVTDNTSDIAAESAKQLSISIIPLTVHFDHETFLNRVDILIKEFYRPSTRGDLKQMKERQTGWVRCIPVSAFSNLLSIRSWEHIWDPMSWLSVFSKPDNRL